VVGPHYCGRADHPFAVITPITRKGRTMRYPFPPMSFNGLQRRFVWTLGLRDTCDLPIGWWQQDLLLDIDVGQRTGRLVFTGDAGLRALIGGERPPRGRDDDYYFRKWLDRKSVV